MTIYSQGASTRLSTLPIEEEEYMLNKKEFWDVVNIRYGWPLSRTPRTCTCGNNFYIYMQKRRVHYTLSQQTKKHNRQPTKRSVLWCSHWTTLRAANTSDESRLDVAARGFCAVGQIALFDIRVSYSNATRYASSNENEKKRKYNNRVMNVEQRYFMPLAFSANGGMGCECKKFYSVLAELITLKRKQEYCITMSWLRRKISFSLMRSILLCIRGSLGKNVNQEEMNVANDIGISESLLLLLVCLFSDK